MQLQKPEDILKESFAAVDVKKISCKQNEIVFKVCRLFRLYLEQHADVVRFCYKKDPNDWLVCSRIAFCMYLQFLWEEAGIHVRFIVENLPKSEQEKMKDFRSHLHCFLVPQNNIRKQMQFFADVMSRIPLQRLAGSEQLYQSTRCMDLLEKKP